MNQDLLNRIHARATWASDSEARLLMEAAAEIRRLSAKPADIVDCRGMIAIGSTPQDLRDMGYSAASIEWALEASK